MFPQGWYKINQKYFLHIASWAEVMASPNPSSKLSLAPQNWNVKQPKFRREIDEYSFPVIGWEKVDRANLPENCIEY